MNIKEWLEQIKQIEASNPLIKIEVVNKDLKSKFGRSYEGIETPFAGIGGRLDDILLYFYIAECEVAGVQKGNKKEYTLYL